MSTQRTTREDPRIEAALGELEATIKARFPSADFQVLHGLGDDPDGVYLEATVDAEDTDAVMDAVIDRLVELEVDEGLPIYVLPVRTPERIARHLASRRRWARQISAALQTEE